MLYLIGLGLSEEKDITVRGLDAIRQCSRVYLEAYTSILLVQKEQLETFYGKEILLADRELVESGSDEILDGAGNTDVAFLIVGDPFGATTHTDLLLRARSRGVNVQVIHNASIMNAIAACGLQLYNFGQTVSLVFFTDSWKPDSFYDRLKENQTIGLHTLVLLDIKVKEQSFENLARGKKVYEPPRYMSVATAAQQLLEIEEIRGEGVCTPSALAIGVSRIGSPSQQMLAGCLQELCSADLGPPLHSLVLVGRRLHELEIEYIKEFAIDKPNFLNLVHTFTAS